MSNYFDDLMNPKPGANEALGTTWWQPMADAPQDGRWIIGVCHDGMTLYRVSWGRGRNGDLGWCSAEKCFGERFFRSWISWPVGR